MPGGVALEGDLSYVRLIKAGAVVVSGGRGRSAAGGGRYSVVTNAGGSGFGVGKVYAIAGGRWGRGQGITH